MVAAKVPRKRNDDGGPSQGEEKHAARAQQKLFKEFQMLFRQPCISGDDMNIIQVGRPAVSRYHQVRRLFGYECGPNYETHDFPLPELGIKLGGFMVLNPPTPVPVGEQENLAACLFDHHVFRVQVWIHSLVVS